MSLAELGTPALLLDRTRLARNLARMRTRARELGVAFRPHLKTAKCIEVARLAQPGAGGLTVSTVREAEFLAAHGFRDLIYAVAIAPQKLTRLAALLRAGSRVPLAVDHPAAAAAVSAAGLRLGVTFEVLIEIDSGEARSGLAPEAPDLLGVAAALAPGATVAGVFTHGGHAYAGRTPADHAAVAEQERAAVTAAAARLEAAGHPCPIRSVGSSPTLAHARHLAGITEVRAGVAMFGDLFQAGIGVVAMDDLALSVLATVIGQRPRLNQLVIDAGAFALSKDRSTEKLGPAGDCGYGLVTPAAGGPPLPGWRVESVYQEHGLIRSSAPLDFAAHPIGSQVRILPNHACPTAAAFEQYAVLSPASDLEAVWTRVNGW
jgi:D-serine deaminase-like pyridoxal phosphate-dependent protein